MSREELERRAAALASASSDVDADQAQRLAAFAVNFRNSFRALWLLARGIVRDAALAEDVLQDAALIALDKLKGFELGTNFTAWMGQVVRYVALNHLRRTQRTRTAPLDPEGLAHRAPATGHGSDAGLLRLEAGGHLPTGQVHFDDRVARALDELNETARVCLLLRTLEDLSYAEIARLLAIPAGTAMSHVHRARQYLRERLSVPVAPSGGTHSGQHSAARRAYPSPG